MSRPACKVILWSHNGTRCICRDSKTMVVILATSQSAILHPSVTETDDVRVNPGAAH